MPPRTEGSVAPRGQPHISIRPPSAADGAALWALARRSGLDLNSPYAYLLWGEYFAGTSVVAEVDGQLAGFVTGFVVPERPDALFVWQIAVDDAYRGAGIGSAMLDALARRQPVRYLEATVTPSNAPSAALFHSFAERHGGAVTEDLLFAGDGFPAGDHEAEIRLRIGPFAAC